MRVVLGLVLVASTTLGCTGVATALRADYAQPTSGDVARLTVQGADTKYYNFLSAVTDPAACTGFQNLGGSMDLEGERTVRVAAGKPFAFSVDLNNGRWSCEQLLIFTPEPGADYRARVTGDPGRCGIELKKNVAGAEEDVRDVRRIVVRKSNGRAVCEGG